MTRLTVAETPQQACDLAASRLREAIETASGKAHIALAGGTTPQPVYRQLGEQVKDWSHVELWLGDERLVSPDDPESNLRMIKESFGAESTPAALVHPVQTQLSAGDAAHAYGSLYEDRCPQLTLALLGLGEDAHTASLFPGAPALDERRRSCVDVHNAPKPPRDRVTMTLPVFAKAGRLILLATGSQKARAVAATLGAPTPKAPASLLAREKLEMIVDRAAGAIVSSDDKNQNNNPQ